MLRFGASEDTTKFLTFDLKTQKWTDLAAGTFVNWAVSQDGKYLHFYDRRHGTKGSPAKKRAGFTQPKIRAPVTNLRRSTSRPND